MPTPTALPSLSFTCLRQVHEIIQLYLIVALQKKVLKQSQFGLLLRDSCMHQKAIILYIYLIMAKKCIAKIAESIVPQRF